MPRFTKLIKKFFRYKLNTAFTAGSLIAVAVFLAAYFGFIKPVFAENKIAKEENVETETIVKAKNEGLKIEIISETEKAQTKEKIFVTDKKPEVPVKKEEEPKQKPKPVTAKSKSVSANNSNPNNPSSVPTHAPTVSIFESEVANLINLERQKVGLNIVSTNFTLVQAARNKSADMLAKDYFAHRTPEGKTDFEFASELGYHYSKIGSNLAWGYTSPEQLVKDWMNSPSHRANILRQGVDEIGIASAGKYCTMIVASD